MFWIFNLLTVAVLIELIVGYRPFKSFRKPLTWLACLLLPAAGLGLLITFPGIVSALLLSICLYSAIAVARLAADKMVIDYHDSATQRTALWLAFVKVGLAYGVLLAWYWQIAAGTIMSIIIILQMACSLIVLLASRRQLAITLPLDSQSTVSNISDKRLPSVTVAVPARNDDGQLAGCLESLLASNYPKLEILALDDDSQDRTADVIRGFAHAGVRFISGPALDGAWLPKNHAYAALAKAASGDYLLFCGSDIRVEKQTIRNMVAAMTNKRKTMLAIVPQNTAAQQLSVVQSMRYFWELALPRRLFRRPPVLSSFWMVQRQQLVAAGGFEAVRRSVAPEAHFARYAVDHDDGYSFVRSTPELGVSSEKSLHNQRESVLFNRYPQLHRRPELVALVALSELVLLLTPLAAILMYLTGNLSLLVAGISIVALAGLVYAFGSIQRTIFPKLPSWQAYSGCLTAFAADIYYLNRSMLMYEFAAAVQYSGRNVSAQIRDNDRKG